MSEIKEAGVDVTIFDSGLSAAAVGMYCYLYTKEDEIKKIAEEQNVEDDWVFTQVAFKAFPNDDVAMVLTELKANNFIQ